MPQTKFISYPWPLGGINRRWSFENQPQVTTPDAVNVRPTDSIGDRERGGSRPGLVKAYSTQLTTGAGNSIYMLETVRYVEDQQIKSRLVAASGGKLWMQSDYGEMVAITSSVNFSRFNSIMAAEFQGKLYIANSGRSTSGDWVSPAVLGQVEFCVGQGDYGAKICWFGGQGDRDASDEVIERTGLDSAPIVFDPIAKTATAVVATAGTIPNDCSIITVYHGRLVLAGSASSPQQWFMSKLLDPTGWDYAAESTDGDAVAVSGTQSKAGYIGDPITALAPFTDQCMVMSCRTSLWSLRGDPVTGTMDCISREIGILDKHAWCTTNSGDMVFLSHDGVYMMPARCGGSIPISLSREVMPKELLDVDPTIFTITLRYDTRARGVHIFLSSNDPANIESQHWFLDMEPRSETRAFYRVTLNSDFDPLSACHRRDITTDQSPVMLGCRDGYIRRFDADAEDDDGEVFSSYYYAGPIAPPGDNEQLKITAISGKLDAGSGPVKWEIYVSHSAAEAYVATAAKSGRIATSGRLIWTPVNLSGGAFFVKVSARTPGEAWAIEELLLGVQQSQCGACAR